MTGRSDRTVHGRTFDGGEIVRYDRSGKWWVEYAHSRCHVPLAQAAEEATYYGARAIIGLPGGRRFDALVARQNRKAQR